MHALFQYPHKSIFNKVNSHAHEHDVNKVIKLLFVNYFRGKKFFILLHALFYRFED